MATDALREYHERIDPYLAMMQQFVAGDLTATSFDTVFQARYLADDTPWPKPIFDILDAVFATADNVVEDPEVRPQIAFATSPEELRERVGAAVVELRDLVGEG